NTKAPLGGLSPGGWIDVLTPGSKEANALECHQKLQGFIGGSLLHPPEQDLNAYFVLGLNEDATISVVDPLFGFGGSKLLEMVFLKSPGTDWVMSKDQDRLYVSMAEAGAVAVVDTESWKVLGNVAVGPQAGRVALAPDGRFLWVAVDGGDAPGVAVIDIARAQVAARIATGAGVHDLAIDGDDRFAFVANRDAGTVSVIDARSLAKVRDVPVCRRPTSIDWSPLAAQAFVACEGDGRIAVVAADSDRPVAMLEAEPGLAQIRFAPGGRLAFVPNPRTNHVSIIDSTIPKIVQTADVETGPDQVSFTETLAYVRHRGTDTVLMIPVDQVGREGKPVPVLDFTGGQTPPGRMDLPTPAAGIVEAPEGSGVLVANPTDKMIYFYKEGMAAPMGSFQNYGRQPRAVLAVDRAIRPAGRGTYETTFTLGKPGRRELAIVVDSPRIAQCFPFSIAENAGRPSDRVPTAVEMLTRESRIATGTEQALRFRLHDSRSGVLRTGLRDVSILTFLSPGLRRRLLPAAEVEPGLYEARFAAPEEGIWFVFVESASAGLPVQKSPALVLEAIEALAAQAELTPPSAGGSTP